MNRMEIKNEVLKETGVEYHEIQEMLGTVKFLPGKSPKTPEEYRTLIGGLCNVVRKERGQEPL